MRDERQALLLPRVERETRRDGEQKPRRWFPRFGWSVTSAYRQRPHGDHPSCAAVADVRSGLVGATEARRRASGSAPRRPGAPAARSPAPARASRDRALRGPTPSLRSPSSRSRFTTTERRKGIRVADPLISLGLHRLGREPRARRASSRRAFAPRDGAKRERFRATGAFRGPMIFVVCPERPCTRAPVSRWVSCWFLRAFGCWFRADDVAFAVTLELVDQAPPRRDERSPAEDGFLRSTPQLATRHLDAEHRGAKGFARSGELRALQAVALVLPVDGRIALRDFAETRRLGVTRAATSMRVHASRCALEIRRRFGRGAPIHTLTFVGGVSRRSCCNDVLDARADRK